MEISRSSAQRVKSFFTVVDKIDRETVRSQKGHRNSELNSIKALTALERSSVMKVMLQKDWETINALFP